jgi:2-polyprenyl-3-methyl-5-hydroxy-6-metoxy-1,4-benzoquinol methylase
VLNGFCSTTSDGNIMLEFAHSLPQTKLVQHRHPYIVDYCRDKKVLHIGCVDAGLMHERYENRQLLHQKLDDVCSGLWGVDIDQEGIEFLRSNDFENVYVMDATKKINIDRLSKQRFNVIVFSEVVEHLLNPGDMLTAIRGMMSDDTRLLMTAPNAYSAMPIISMMKGIEWVHPDHNYYFSHVTLRNLAIKSGLVVEEEALYTFFNTKDLPVAVGNAMIKYKSNLTVHYGIQPWNLKIFFRKLIPVNVYRSLKKRLNKLFIQMFIKYLFSKTTYWADGIILVCKKVKADEGV